jgi:hypothetical protein
MHPAKKLLEFLSALAVDRPGAGHGFNQQQPIPPGAMNNHIRHPGGAVERDAEPHQIVRLEVGEFVLGVPDVDHQAPRHEMRAKVFDDGLDERILPTR